MASTAVAIVAKTASSRSSPGPRPRTTRPPRNGARESYANFAVPTRDLFAQGFSIFSAVIDGQSGPPVIEGVGFTQDSGNEIRDQGLRNEMRARKNSEKFVPMGKWFTV